MADGATGNYGWPLMANGSHEDSWGDVTNDTLSRIDQTVKAVQNSVDALSSNANGRLPLSGGTLSGALTVPALSLDSTFSLQRDANNAIIAFDTNDTLYFYRPNNTFATVIGNTIRHAITPTEATYNVPLTLTSPGSSPNSATAKNYVDSLHIQQAGDIAARLVRTGDTMSGPLTTPRLQLDSQFALYTTGQLPTIAFDGGDYIGFDRVANALNVVVTNTIPLQVTAGFVGAQVPVVLNVGGTAPNHAVRKDYVDSLHVAQAGDVNARAPLAGANFTGAIAAPEVAVVSETPTIRLGDTTYGNRWIRHADGQIQFLNSGANLSHQYAEDGNVYSTMFGWFNEAFLRANVDSTHLGNFTVNGSLGVNGNHTVGGSVTCGGVEYCDVYRFRTDSDTGIQSGGDGYVSVISNNALVATFDANGGLTTSGGMYANSDARLKTSVETITGGLALAEQMRGVRYERIGRPGIPQIGYIAQEVQALLPEVIGVAPDGTLSVAYQQVVAVHTEAIKELSALVREQAATISTLETRLAALENPQPTPEPEATTPEPEAPKPTPEPEATNPAPTAEEPVEAPVVVETPATPETPSVPADEPSAPVETPAPAPEPAPAEEPSAPVEEAPAPVATPAPPETPSVPADEPAAPTPEPVVEKPAPEPEKAPEAAPEPATPAPEPTPEPEPVKAPEPAPEPAPAPAPTPEPAAPTPAPEAPAPEPAPVETPAPAEQPAAPAPETKAPAEEPAVVAEPEPTPEPEAPAPEPAKAPVDDPIDPVSEPAPKSKPEAT